MLHQLRRVEKGLRGEVLKPEDDMDGFDTTSYPTTSLEENGVELPQGNDTELDARIASMRRSGRSHEGEDEDTPMMDDAPIENYQEQMRHQGQGIFEGEIDDRTNVVGALRVNTPSQGQKRRHDEMNGDTPVQDKEAKKRAKKARKKDKQLQKQSARKDTGDREESVELDETRELHDEAGPSSTFLPDKVSETVVAPSAPKSTETDQPQAEEHSTKIKRKRDHKLKRSNIEVDTPTESPRPVSPTETKPTNGTTVPDPSSEKQSTTTNRNRKRNREKEKDQRPGKNKRQQIASTTNGVHKSPDSPLDSPMPKTNGITSIPETPQATKKRKLEGSSKKSNGTSNETIIGDSQVTVPESPATNHKLSNGIKHGDEEKRDERSERKRLKKAEKEEKRRKKELKHGKRERSP